MQLDNSKSRQHLSRHTLPSNIPSHTLGGTSATRLWKHSPGPRHYSSVGVRILLPRQKPVAKSKNIFKEVERSKLPGNVPNTAWRRLLADIKDALSLEDLLRMYKISAKNTRVWQARHAAAMLTKAAALTYYKALSAAAGQPTPPDGQQAAVAGSLSSNRSSQVNDNGASSSSSSSRGGNVSRAGTGPQEKGLKGSFDSNSRGSQSRIGVQPMHVQLQHLLTLIYSGKEFGQAARMVQGFRLAQLLVACSNLRAQVPPGFQGTLVHELLRDSSKKLTGCGTSLLAELVVSLARTLPFQPAPNTFSLPTSPLLQPSLLHPPPSPFPFSPLLPGTPLAPSTPSHQMSPPSPSSSAHQTGALKNPTIETASPLEQQQQLPPPPSVRQLAVRKHARTRESLRQLFPEMQAQLGPQSLGKTGPGADSHGVDLVRLWGELHRATHARLRARAASPTEIARMAWGFAQAGYHEEQLFSAFEDALLPTHANTMASSLVNHDNLLLGSASSSSSSSSSGNSSNNINDKADSNDIHNDNNSSSWAWKSASELAIPSRSNTLPLSPQSLANLAYAFARAGHSSPHLMSAVSAQFLKAASDAQPAHIAKLCWACVTSGWEHVGLQAALAQHMLHARCRYTVPEICTILWAYSHWDRHRHAPLLALFARELVKPIYVGGGQIPASVSQPKKSIPDEGRRLCLIHTASNAELASIARSYSHELRPPLLDVMQSLVEERLEHMTDEELACVLSALFTAGCKSSASIECASRKLLDKTVSGQAGISLRTRANLLQAMTEANVGYLGSGRI
mmetsp:Transcript_9442/g.24065  ORF Transcript_9442/g.24065 Transcript_9442/m.24065 type:complete len:794 (-) Transcript_9442:292-2673(-)|eukprot:CAMPEP_0202372176 /NCGR_PEP_ID=MMETSP1127-20130417/3418_1 /ASSEMBLY_ACC=CAM_ASM_000462 /TAXON_ID=3047 /ORGANISM="Dunaliella tertiolecta, Strain CCMP1320" /LENGTH=793 /DNA_ID=CAMNT_0048968633 /DNA_START=43 /DNA_END=2424 /DNA_ORIENTATION=-